MDEKRTDTPAVTARLLLGGADHAALATVDADGGPHASLVLLATGPDLRPLMLLSDLSVHAGNLKADPRMSLLIDGSLAPARDLSEPRLTLNGRAEAVEAPALLDRFLTRHRSARAYAGFADFRLYSVTPVAGHLVAGFGAIHRLDAADLLTA